MTTTEAGESLSTLFAPWVPELGPAVEAVGEGRAVLRLPWSERPAREGGGLSGQAPMAGAGTATVIAAPAARGGFVPLTTVRQPTSFRRAVTSADVLIEALLTKLGRRMASADVKLTDAAWINYCQPPIGNDQLST
ncbi:PaaI family thioesterase [Streptomyces achromogenes]|uniref:PaaI family thioesterase n=1 Tax=Streptomyces achromogenes TaxID=67255 RepID=UPI0036CEC8D1